MPARITERYDMEMFIVDRESIEPVNGFLIGLQWLWSLFFMRQIVVAEGQITHRERTIGILPDIEWDFSNRVYATHQYNSVFNVISPCFYWGVFLLWLKLYSARALVHDENKGIYYIGTDCGSTGIFMTVRDFYPREPGIIDRISGRVKSFFDGRVTPFKPHYTTKNYQLRADPPISEIELMSPRD